MELIKNNFLWSYVIPVLFGFLLASLFPAAKHYQPTDKKKYYYIQIITLVSALIGAKLTALIGDRLWPLVEVNYHDIFLSGRSIVGGLVFGFIAAEISKPLFKYQLPPNDRFASILPFSVAIGRFGCLFSGCCRGIFYDGFFSITYADHTSHFPAPIVEIIFHTLMGITFFQLMKRKLFTGQLFSIYLISYGIFRFLTEFLRITSKEFSGLSFYQWMSLVMIGLGFFSFVIRNKQRLKTA